ncbi:PilX N-terminal domain-containing pilus assembly protein [Endozoicomonas sp. SCSIO W0465]|uniref:pilus assembly PilX family protein n=1 Tax=Endozoicomonas sp. SCSIO W0465 TaxID=2918516 RepID=UPI002075C7AC|nr:PilX N-terminal domain-containing pilus assembly protein [Endozoicomonas sp. SCSIO W0465]USE37529.1 PilX N-terminal domain-containing pilus assembly protein [Endozoicomonas sp. SCSIO W0465]
MMGDFLTTSRIRQSTVPFRKRSLLSSEIDEKGSVLLVSLVMLLVITVAGLTAVKMATLEEKMSGNYQDQQMAFYAAEAALKQAENFIADNELALSGFGVNCDNGYCFTGNDIDDIGSCDPGVSEPWLTGTLWSDNGRHRVTTVSISGISAQAKYIIEFRCYIAKEASGPLPDPANRGDWAKFYRITALATGGSGDSRVMLQSSYKKSS